MAIMNAPMFASRSPATAMCVNLASDELFFIFAAAGTTAGATSREFLKRTRLLERNVVMLRDRRNAYYLEGISDDLPTCATLVGWLRQTRERMSHVRRCYCIGSCMGGYAAIWFGHYLDADVVWSFSPLTKAPPTVMGAETAGHDLRQLLMESRGPTEFNIYFSAALQSDVEAAERLALLPNVRLHPQPGCNHQVLETMITLGTIDQLFSPCAPLS